MMAGETTPIPTFPLRGKEISFLRAEKHSLPLRGRARVGVVRLLRLILLGALRDEGRTCSGFQVPSSRFKFHLGGLGGSIKQG
jgi:hypothetical protein